MNPSLLPAALKNWIIGYVCMDGMKWCKQDPFFMEDMEVIWSHTILGGGNSNINIYIYILIPIPGEMIPFD